MLCCGTRASLFHGQLRLGSKQQLCLFPILSDGLERWLCSPTHPDQSRSSQYCHLLVFTPAPVPPPALKGYCTSMSCLHRVRSQRCFHSRYPQPRAEACPARPSLRQDLWCWRLLALLSVPSQAFILPFGHSKLGLWADVTECQGHSLEKTGVGQKGPQHLLSPLLGHCPCRLYSVQPDLFLCRKRYLLKNPHTWSGTG